MSFGVKLILNIKKHQNLTILPKKSINFCKTQHISKKTQANLKKTQANPKKLKQIPKKLKDLAKKTQCTGGKCLPDPPKKREKKPALYARVIGYGGSTPTQEKAQLSCVMAQPCRMC